MTSATVFAVLRRHWLVVLITTLVVGTCVATYSKLEPRTYSSTALAFFSVAGGDTTAGVAQTSSLLLDQMPSYTKLATSPSVLDPVIQSLELDTTAKDLARRVSATTPRDTVVMQIVVRDSAPQEAADIANEIVRKLSDAVGVVGPRSSTGRTLVVASSIQPAVAGIAPVLPNTKQNTALGLAAGLVLGCALVLLAERTRRTVASVDAVARTTDAPVIGVVSRDDGVAGGIARGRPGGRAFEELREMATLVESHLPPTSSRVVLMVSAVAGEGRTTVSQGLAAALVERGHGTVVVEVDARPSGTEPSRSLVDGVDRSVTEPALSGFETSRASALVGSRAPARLGAGRFAWPGLESELDQLAREFDYVLVDTPALLQNPESLPIGALLTDVATIVVVGSGHTRRGQLADVLRRLNNRGLGVLGVVLNAHDESTASSRLWRRLRQRRRDAGIRSESRTRGWKKEVVES